ncbi:MAG: hypothetical protein KGL93_13960 [Gemmatimonadota bacterium]|nr:hypothetical protein [Gemmatimonadota bacterium]HEU4988331.1 hypothetical protein [Gemmatimonadaceae bacterium]
MRARARDLIESTLGGTPYLARALELLALAEREAGDESCAVWTEHAGAVTALGLVGLVAGASGAGRIHLLLGHDSRLVASVCDVLRAMGARFAMAEWPDDAPFAGAIGLLRDAGFAEEARIAGYYRPGVDQVFLRRDL